MLNRISFALAAAALLTTAIQSSRAADAPASAAPGIVSHVKVVSDKVQDVSSLEAWKKSFIKEGMSDQEKAIAIWKSVCMFRHQAAPPVEGLMAAPQADESHVHDPIKAFNVYGYNQCCCASGCIEALARYAGLEARGWGINAHSVPEINVSGHWGMFDASLMDYFMMPDKKTIAGVDDINKSIAEWLEQHPDLKGNSSKQFEGMMKNGGWKSGPNVLAGGNGYDNNGWLPAKTHTWGSSMIEFGGKYVNFPKAKQPFLFDYATAVGYEVNIQLRPGEKLTRSWNNEGHHVNEIDGKKYPVNDKELKYAANWGDLNTSTRIGNGTLEYSLPLASGQFKNSMLTCDNLAAKSESPGANVHVKDASKPATLVFRMPTSYVFLGGELETNAIIPSGGSIQVSLSENNGLDFKPLATLNAGQQKIDLKKLIERRYDYRLKFDLKGEGTGLDAIHVVNEIQNSTRALPALDKGDNKIAFSAGPQEGTITVQGNTKSDFGNLTFKDFHVDIGPKIVIPVTAPGEITRIRAGASYRCSAASDSYTVQASFDEGKTWSDVGKFDGVGRGMDKYLVLDKVPANSKSVQVKLTKNGGVALEDLRLDVDYKEPHGNFMPVKVTYQYDDKTDIHVAKSPTDSYTINCPAKPQMKSITMEVAP